MKRKSNGQKLEVISIDSCVERNHLRDFSKIRNEVIGYLVDGYRLKEIWRYMSLNRRINMSYAHFGRFARREQFKQHALKFQMEG